MKFGLVFFPTVGVGDKSAPQYYDEGLHLAEKSDELGFYQLKTVEHYFFDYGGYSPDPVTFLSAVAARTTRLRVGTGAVIPAFNHPVKLAGKLAMLDNISGGRLDVGFGRAFLPDEFAAFGVPVDESRDRFVEGTQACIRLWSEEDVVWNGQFYQFGPVTLLPRPAQTPHPPIFVAVASSAESAENAGQEGHHLQLIATVAPREQVQELLGIYRKARVASGHRPGSERIDLNFPCFVAEDGDEARRMGRYAEEQGSRKMAEATRSWSTVNSAQYPGYDKIAEMARRAGGLFDERVTENKILAGTPDEVRGQIETIAEWYGEDVTIGLSVHNGHLPVADVERSLQLFADQVMPRLSDA